MCVSSSECRTCCCCSDAEMLRGRRCRHTIILIPFPRLASYSLFFLSFSPPFIPCLHLLTLLLSFSPETTLSHAKVFFMKSFPLFTTCNLLPKSFAFSSSFFFLSLFTHKHIQTHRGCLPDVEWSEGKERCKKRAGRLLLHRRRGNESQVHDYGRSV